MPKYQIEDISILIGDQNRQLRMSLKGVLHQHGFRKIMDASTVKGFEETVRLSDPDFILCDIDLPEGNVCKSINKIRHDKLGQNPFCAIILFIEEPSEDLVKMASEAGVDDLQVKPVVAQNVIDRAHYLIEKRKPFVVTTDYIGPDRRKSDRAGAMKIDRIEVPNVLALKAKGEYNANTFRASITRTKWDVNAQKIERHIYQVRYLVERIVPAYREGMVNRESKEMLIRLLMVSEDVNKRLEDSDFGHISDLTGTLATVAKSIWDRGEHPVDKDLDLLLELSTALSAMVNVDSQDKSVVQQIKSSVQEKYKP